MAVSLNYRMGFLLPYKDAIDCAGYRATQDANAALRYLMHHADFYRINPDLVFTWGSSAGAITALNVAFLRDNNRPESVTKEGRIRKLITVAGASQHSLHVDEHRRIVPYFYTIQDSVTRFFYTEIVPLCGKYKNGVEFCETMNV